MNDNAAYYEGILRDLIDTREREVIQEALGHLYTLPSLDDAGAFLDALGDLGWKVCPK